MVRVTVGPSRQLAQAVLGLRRRFRRDLVVFGVAVAAAADLGYEFLNIAWVTLARGKPIDFPFFFVALGVLLLLGWHRTRLVPFLREVDRRHHLKERLSHAEAYRRDAGISPQVADAQAEETLGVLDLEGIRRSFRRSPLVPSILAAALGAAFLLFRARNPELFSPRGFLLRQGGQVATYIHRAAAPVSPDRIASTTTNPETQPATIFPSPPRPVDPAATTDRSEKPAVHPEEPLPSVTPTPPPPQERPEGDSGKSGGETRDQGQGGDGRERKGGGPPGGPATSLTRMQSKEVTERLAALVQRPFPRPAAPFREPGTGSKGIFLPPIPMLRFLEGIPGTDFFVDPESVYVIPATYGRRYREQISSYFMKIQQMKEDGDGS
jgi:hypothetical protein